MTGNASTIDPAASDVAGYLIALSLLPGVGPATVLACHRDGGVEAAWELVVAGRPRRVAALGPVLARLDAAAVALLVGAARALDPDHELRRHRADGRHVLVRGQPGYPARLAEDPAPPAVLFATGCLDALTRPTVAIVGTRNATRPGRDLAAQLGAELAAAGVAVVSGLALGIDGAAHQGALRAGEAVPGRPVGVIASGLDIAYPRRHVELHAQVARSGLLVSETPLGQRPVAWRFPARNRIIAGLADAVVVVESRSAGGSMLTVGEALYRGVPVLAVPGHPAAPAAAGTNDLLFDGAAIVRSVADVLDAIGISPAQAIRPAVGEASARLPPDQRSVLAAIGDTPAALAEIVARSGLPLDVASEALLRLEADQRVVRTAGWYERTNPPGPVRVGGSR